RHGRRRRRVLRLVPARRAVAGRLLRDLRRAGRGRRRLLGQRAAGRGRAAGAAGGVAARPRRPPPDGGGPVMSNPTFMTTGKEVGPMTKVSESAAAPLAARRT